MSARSIQNVPKIGGRLPDYSLKRPIPSVETGVKLKPGHAFGRSRLGIAYGR